MPASTPCVALPYPLPSDPPDVAGDFKKLADAVDAAICANTGKEVGEVFQFWDTGMGFPPNALVMDGSTFSPVTYPALNTHLGTNQLPDLRGRFLMMATTGYPMGTLGGFANAIVVEHQHAMTHNHGGTATATSVAHTHEAGSLLAANNGAHGHNVGAGAQLLFSSAGGIAAVPLSGSPNVHSTGAWTTTGAAGGLHNHDVSGSTAGMSANASHTHSLSVNNFTGSTSMAGSSGEGRNLPPFAALVFLIQAA